MNVIGDDGDSVAGKGFTLVELAIAVAVLGLLASIAYPIYENHLLKVNRIQVQALLSDLILEQEKFYASNGRYTLDLRELGFEQPDDVVEAGVETGDYQISAQRCEVDEKTPCVLLVASPLLNSKSDEKLSLDTLGRREPFELWQK